MDLGAEHVSLIGGGWDPDARSSVHGGFLERAGDGAAVACVVVDEGDGDAQFARWDQALRATRPCEPFPVLVPLGGTLDVTALGDAAGLYVCGGLTPAYADALAPVGGELRAWLAEGDRPYAGFSAGAAVSARSAVVGGWRDGGVRVCPEDAAEDLDEVAVVPGLGLVPWAVDVHCAQWGTLPRLLAALGRVPIGQGLALDEDTAVHLADGVGRVAGRGTAWRLERTGAVTTVTPLRAGDRVGPRGVDGNSSS
jgi:cyanophycinase